MKALKWIGRLLSSALIVALCLLLAGNVYILAARALTGKAHPTIFGFSSAVVISGSMSGSIEINDLVIVREQDNYSVGDVVMFSSGSSLVTHRIVDAGTEGFITQGDANNAPDPEPVSKVQILGRVIHVIPKVGVIQQVLATPLGMTCLTAGAMLLILGPVILRPSEEEKEGNDENS